MEARSPGSEAVGVQQDRHRAAETREAFLESDQPLATVSQPCIGQHDLRLEELGRTTVGAHSPASP